MMSPLIEMLYETSQIITQLKKITQQLPGQLLHPVY
jgi:hypothetical protein